MLIQLHIFLVLVLLLIILPLFISDADEKSRPLLTMAGVFDVWKSKSVCMPDALSSDL